MNPLAKNTYISTIKALMLVNASYSNTKLSSMFQLITEIIGTFTRVH